MRSVMEPRWLVLIPLTAALLAPACRRQWKAPEEATEEEPPALASIVHVADPATTAQLLRGFYPLEQNSWRWTAGSFAVKLQPPVTAAQRGARLEIKLAVPDPVIQRLRNITLKAKVGSLEVAGETYSKPGEYLYARDVPASALGGTPVVVECTLDKVLEQEEGDRRRLGIVVITVGLAAK